VGIAAVVVDRSIVALTFCRVFGGEKLGWLSSSAGAQLKSPQGNKPYIAAAVNINVQR